MPSQKRVKTTLRSGDVAALYGVSHRTANHMIDTGILKGFRIPGGKERRVNVEEIRAHAQANAPDFNFVLDRLDAVEERHG